MNDFYIATETGAFTDPLVCVCGCRHTTADDVRKCALDNIEWTGINYKGQWSYGWEEKEPMVQCARITPRGAGRALVFRIPRGDDLDPVDSTGYNSGSVFGDPRPFPFPSPPPRTCDFCDVDLPPLARTDTCPDHEDAEWCGRCADVAVHPTDAEYGDYGYVCEECADAIEEEAMAYLAGEAE